MKAPFITETETKIEQIKKNMLLAFEPNQKWGMYNGNKQQELLKTQIDQGMETANNKLTDVSFSVDQECIKTQTEISNKLYPMLNSAYGADRSRGENNRLFAIERVAKLENVIQFNKIYTETIEQLDIDLATNLIDSGELKFTLPNDKLLINELKSKHVATLELNELLIKREQLKTLKKNVDQLRKQYLQGYVKPLSMAKTAEEHLQMMLERGLAV